MIFLEKVFKSTVQCESITLGLKVQSITSFCVLILVNSGTLLSDKEDNMAMNYTTDGTPLSTPDVSILEQTQYRAYDGLIAIGFCACVVVGLPGNCLALRYFLQTKKRNLSTLLYIVACSIDIGSCIIHLPVTANLLNNRHPGLLGNRVFCVVWYFTLLLLQQMSMFVVMLLSLLRAVVILSPFYKIKKKHVLTSIVATLLYHFAWNVLYIIFHDDYYHAYGIGYCQIDSEATLDTLYMINYTVCTGVPPLIVFVALVLSIAQLQRQNMAHASQRHNRQASMTIIYFAAIFLVCNFLTFLNNALYTFTKIANKSYPGPIYKSTFMFFYSWLLSEIFCTVLNASLNPILYLWRMREIRLWAMRLERSLITRIRNPTIQSRIETSV